VAAAFTVSALVHAYPVAVVSSWVEPAMVLGFFLAHAVLVLVERRIHVNGWPPAAGRAWTLACFVLTGPLLALPLLHLWDGGAP
jgi:hypothetical protein